MMVIHLCCRILELSLPIQTFCIHHPLPPLLLLPLVTTSHSFYFHRIGSLNMLPFYIHRFFFIHKKNVKINYTSCHAGSQISSIKQSV